MLSAAALLEASAMIGLRLSLVVVCVPQVLEADVLLRLLGLAT